MTPREGLDPTLCFYDELHAAKDKGKLYTAMKLALKKPEACLCTISSAGYDERGALGEMRKEFLRETDQFHEGRLTFVYKEASASSMFEWAIRDDDDPDDFDTVKLANPASFVTAEKLRRQRHAPGLPYSDYLIFRCGRWAKIAGNETWINMDSWRGCYEEGVTIPLGSKVVLGVDIGFSKDASAVVMLHRRDDGHVPVKLSGLWTPPGDGTMIDNTLVMHHIRDLCSKYEVTDVVYDHYGFGIPAQELLTERIPMREFVFQGGSPVEATTSLMEGVENTIIVQDGDPHLAEHVEGGRLKLTTYGYKLDKRPGKRNDALIALMMAYSYLSCACFELRGTRTALLLAGRGRRRRIVGLLRTNSYLPPP